MVPQAQPSLLGGLFGLTDKDSSGLALFKDNLYRRKAAEGTSCSKESQKRHERGAKRPQPEEDEDVAPARSKDEKAKGTKRSAGAGESNARPQASQAEGLGKAAGGKKRKKGVRQQVGQEGDEGEEGLVSDSERAGPAPVAGGGEAGNGGVVEVADSGSEGEEGEGEKEEEEGGGEQADAAVKHRSSPTEVESEQLARTVFVGSLPKDLSQKAIKKLFRGYGRVETVRLRSIAVEESKMPRRAAVILGKLSSSRDSVNAYVRFQEPEAAAAALELNMTEVMGHHIRVDMATPPAKRTGKPGEGDRQDEELYTLLMDGGGEALSGQLEAVRIVRDPQTMAARGVAFVLFKSQAAASAALRLRLVLRGRELRISRLRLSPTGADGRGRGGGTGDKGRHGRPMEPRGALGRAGGLRPGPATGPPGHRAAERRPPVGAARGSARRGKRPAVLARKLAAQGAAMGGVALPFKGKKKKDRK